MNLNSITADQVRRNRPDLAAQLEAEARAAVAGPVATNAAKDERSRIAAIDGVALPGYEDLIAEAKADGHSSASDVALQIARVERSRFSGLAKQDLDPEGVVSGRSGQANAPLEDRAKAEWNRNPTLRAEFRESFDAYVSLLRAEERGAVSVLRATS